MGGGSKTETSNKIDPQLMALYQQNYNQAQAVANTPFQPYTGERVAGFNPTQMTGQNVLLSLAGDPAAGNSIAKAQGSVAGLMDYRPPTIAAPPGVTAGQLSGTDLSPYLNPYTDQVVNSALADLQHMRQQQGVADNVSATAAHAFGGTRQAVQNANTTDDYLRNVASTSAGLRQAGYVNAQQAALADIGNRLNADQFNATGVYNTGVANAANDLAGANFRLNVANQYAGLGTSYFNQLAQQGNLYSAVGAQQQALQQAQDDAAYEEFMRQLNFPYQQQQLRNQAVSMIPIQQTQTQTTSKSPGVLDVIGTVGHLFSPIKFPGT